MPSPPPPQCASWLPSARHRRMSGPRRCSWAANISPSGRQATFRKSRATSSTRSLCGSLPNSHIAVTPDPDAPAPAAAMRLPLRLHAMELTAQTFCHSASRLPSRFHTKTLTFWLTARRRESGDHATDLTPSSTLKTGPGVPPGFHNRTVRSCAPEASHWPSGLHATVKTSAVCPCNSGPGVPSGFHR